MAPRGARQPVLALWRRCFRRCARDRRFRQQPRPSVGCLRHDANRRTCAGSGLSHDGDTGARPRPGGRLSPDGMAHGARTRSCRRSAERRRRSAGAGGRRGCGGQRLPRPNSARAAASGAHRRDRNASLSRPIVVHIPHRRKRTGRRAYPGRAGRRHLRGVRGRDRRSVRAPLPLSVRQLHSLRAPAEHRHRHPL